MTYTRLGELTGVNKTVIFSMISRKSATLESLTKYANVLRVPVWELLYDCGTPCVGKELESWSDQKPELRIKEIMNSKRITSKIISERTGMKQPNISKSLNKYNMNISSIENFAKGLDVPVWELFVSREEMAAEIARRRGNECSPRVEEHGLLNFDDSDSVDDEGNCICAPDGMTFVPMLPNGQPDLSKLVQIDTPHGKMLAIRIVEKVNI